MHSGKLNARIAIQQRQTGTGPIGQPINTWVDIATVWASVRHNSGLETIKADASVSTVKASIRIRWRTDIKADMRVMHGETTYDIKAVLPDMTSRQHVDLVCEVVQ